MQENVYLMCVYFYICTHIQLPYIYTLLLFTGDMLPTFMWTEHASQSIQRQPDFESHNFPSCKITNNFQQICHFHAGYTM